MGFELTTSTTPPSTALFVTSTNCAIETTLKKDCSNSTDIGIDKCSLRRILSSSYALHLFGSPKDSLPDSENTSEIR